MLGVKIEESTLDFAYILFLAIGLAMDAFSVSTAAGFTLKKVNLYQASKISINFGLFHIIMPVLGWYAGSKILWIIADYDHWAAFLILLFVGGRMIIEAIRTEEKIEPNRILNNFSLLLFSIAVSIDAIAIGLSFYLENIPIIQPAIIIGAVTFVCSFIGIIIGNKIGRLIGRSAQVIGGIILILIGLKIIITHVL